MGWNMTCGYHPRLSAPACNKCICSTSRCRGLPQLGTEHRNTIEIPPWRFPTTSRWALRRRTRTPSAAPAHLRGRGLRVTLPATGATASQPRERRRWRSTGIVHSPARGRWRRCDTRTTHSVTTRSYAPVARIPAPTHWANTYMQQYLR